MIRQQEAKLIARELYDLILPDIKKIVKEYAQQDNEEFLTISQAAEFLNVSPCTLYRTKNKIGYTKVGNQLRFPKSSLIRATYNGRLKADNVS